MATSEPQKLPFDAVLSILDRITDKNSLYECARTCRSFHEAVIPNLYKSISVVVARYHKSLPQLGPFKAIETHPYLRQYVKSVEISLGLYDYNMHRDRLVPLWKALSHLSNITSFTLKHPEDTYFHLPGILTASIVSALAGCEKLERLTVLSAISAISIERFSSLKTVKAVRFGHLLSSQTLNALGKWFRQAEGGFHTLGILIAHAVGAGDIDQLTPYVSSLHTLHIGRNHGLPPRDLLSLLVHTPRLQFLDVTYYGPQPLGLVERGSGYLNQLQNLAVRYYGFSDLSSSHDFHHWIEYVASSSPLKSFSLISNDRRKYELARELLSILYTKTELEVLNIPDVLLGRSELGTLLGTFKKLRVLSLFLPDINLLYLGPIRGPPLILLQEFYRSFRSSDLQLTSITAIYLRPPRIVDFPYPSLTGVMKQTMRALRGNPGYVHIWEGEALQALWTATGPTTDRARVDLLKYEYPDVYGHIP